MDDIVLTRTLLQQGLDRRDINRLRRREELLLVRRGAYAREPLGDATASETHRRIIAATVPQLDDGAVVALGSAAALHQLPLWPAAVGKVHIIRDRRGGGQRRSVVQVQGAPLTADDITVVAGIPVTSLARTVLDLAPALPMEQAVAAGDRALAHGLDPHLLELGLARMERWPGVRQARRTVAFLDARSESAGESVSRVGFARDGLPAPEPQRNIYGPDGRLVARVDFCWDEQRTVGEFDGKEKYGRLLKPGQLVADVLFAEKVREDALRDLGWQVVRWIWADLYRPGVVRDRLLRAFARRR